MKPFVVLTRTYRDERIKEEFAYLDDYIHVSIWPNHLTLSDDSSQDVIQIANQNKYLPEKRASSSDKYFVTYLILPIYICCPELVSFKFKKRDFCSVIKSARLKDLVQFSIDSYSLEVKISSDQNRITNISWIPIYEW